MQSVGRRIEAEDWVAKRKVLYENEGEQRLPPDLRAKLGSLQNRYAGQRIFIIGNGPSLNKTDLSRLRNEFTFAVNKFYLLYDSIDWTPTFYTALDWRVVPDIFHQINGLTGSTKFLDYRYNGLLADSRDSFWYSHEGVHEPDLRAQGFSPDAGRGLVGAGSVVGSAIQLAYFMGFDPVYLIGCDLGYTVPSTVRQEGPDQFQNGVKLNLTSTQDDDPNHFSPKYFGAGSKWHDPNVKRMVSGHEACQRFFVSQGRTLANATVGGELEVHPRVNYDDLFPSRGAAGLKSGMQLFEAVGPFVRESFFQIDESALVRSLSAGIVTESRPVMLDVGAHFGTTSLPFYSEGWEVHAFEPDEQNRQKLQRAFDKAAPGMTTFGRGVFEICAFAVSDTSDDVRPLFRSPTSSGISGLHSFVDDHANVDSVRTIRLDDYMDQHGIEKCHFLKIDTEGHDLFALRSFPMLRQRPPFVVVEFDNSKTLPLGYSVGTLAELLIDQGYVVFVSEWFPVVRYGAIHSWKGMFEWGAKPLDPKAWGNLVAVQAQTWPAVSDLMGTAVTKSVAAATSAAALRRGKQGATRTANVKIAEPSKIGERQNGIATRAILRLTHTLVQTLDRHPGVAHSVRGFIRRNSVLRRAARQLYAGSPGPTRRVVDDIVKKSEAL